ncbi:MAG: DoxX family protein [Candidatus Levybacteria bacterium GW2011_GWB1_39_7]|nr:MAG: DoxX family protein [Candidatus Levybacteria bacterium GW2011_GWB1_39_7]OGH15469.1 MAG: hypothetical protein A2689_02565 [Candidatus Levybacteria bacterium RIFCSPHIGHO2_01_FULL_38_96]OGH36233.1 MAG: hypothetical protein A3B43_00100 [Candidatus Levybacteria bacterium RIFCSPLOWO2_01_FULL_38_120]OGH45559.1 MAG: hypothetical protein A3H82_02610 [Candidatus Levybacteria bacterium RIFCSPLOWO2_02_FULL_39_26]OGH48390.1 MAG: hypothetical protein A3G66_00365 [Candidatus Levybacteria bacterium RIF
MQKQVFALLRITLGFIFLWAFFDKLLGLGFATTPEKAWLAGGSPTLGYLKFGTHGPFAGTFQTLAGNVMVDWLFMLGLLGVGAAFVLGIALRFAALGGGLMMILMWLSAFPPKNNPLIDEHIIYLLVLLSIGRVETGNVLGLGKWWAKTSIAKNYPILR